MGFTRNYKNKILSSFYPISDGTNSDFVSTNTVVMKTLAGTIRRGVWELNNQFMGNYGDNNKDYIRVQPMYANSVIFGTNSAEESIDDYTISEVNTLVYQSKKSTLHVNNNGGFTVNFEYTIYNPTDIVLNEFGIYDIVHYKTDVSAESFLIYRKKLDEPINLLADAPVTVSFDVVFPPII